MLGNRIKVLISLLIAALLLTGCAQRVNSADSGFYAEHYTERNKDDYQKDNIKDRVKDAPAEENFREPTEILRAEDSREPTAEQPVEDAQETSSEEDTKEPSVEDVQEPTPEQPAPEPPVEITEALLPPDMDSSGFVLISEAIPDVILEPRYYSTYNFVGARIDGYEEPLIFVTKEAAEALKKVNDTVMGKGFRLKIYDAYRPVAAVEHFVRWASDRDDTLMKDIFYPNVDKKDLFSLGFIAKRSGHSRGSTVDLTIFDEKQGKDADMGGTFDFFGDISHYAYSGLTSRQRENRKILRDAMMDAGFKPISTEWWHFTLKDEPYPDTYFNFPVNSESIMR